MEGLLQLEIIEASRKREGYVDAYPYGGAVGAIEMENGVFS